MRITKRLFRNLLKRLNSNWYPWAVIGSSIIFLLLLAFFQLNLLRPVSGLGLALFWFLAILGLILALIVFYRLNDLQNSQKRLEEGLAESQQSVSQAYQQLEAIFRLNQNFIEAGDENDVIVPMLRLAVDMTGAEGASFVPLDDHGQPKNATSHGEFPPHILHDWLEYLASPGVRTKCSSCGLPQAPEKPANCPLSKGPYSEATGWLCYPIRRGEREFGMLTLFMSKPESLDERKQAFLRTLIEETALGLESIRLRRRELVALRQMYSFRRKKDLKAWLLTSLENVQRTLESDFALMSVKQYERDLHEEASQLELTLGDIDPTVKSFVEGIIERAISAKKPVLLNDLVGGPAPVLNLHSLVCEPMISPEGVVRGAILAGNWHTRSFSQRHSKILQTLAGQIALIAQNADWIAELEYQAMMQERTRLAREIHDGLAQTLGFLKLQVAQMRNYFLRGDLERARQGVDIYYETLSDAYQDARVAIDGLRISPHECGLTGWLNQTVEDFKEVSELSILVKETNLSTSLPTEIQAQLIRIVQEALSNVRKHAQAKNVWIECRETDSDIVLEVRDDGLGFTPEDVTQSARYGLLGMRERAELIGGDFQVISRQEEGTTVRIRLNLNDLREVMN